MIPPRVSLCLLPTPLHRLDRMSATLGIDLWIKRDDLTGFAMGGNKGRKLEYLLSDALAQKAEVVVTCGATQSNLKAMSNMQGSILREGRTGTLVTDVVDLARRLVQSAKRHTDTRDLVGRPVERLAHYKKIVDLASLQAKIGIWECDLATNALAWTEGVYDLFELPRYSPVTRAQAVAFYHPTSRREMEVARSRAIAERSAFSLDANVTTAKGNERWMRLTGNVECEDGRPVRLFGMKQDITAERALLDRLRVSAEIDPLTGLANRAVLEERLTSPTGALMLIDLDGFKTINDTDGHSAGDECLRQIATRLLTVCDERVLVARMGGDEFAVVMDAGASGREAEALANAILAVLSGPIQSRGRVWHLSGSIGISVPSRLSGGEGPGRIVEADLALYAAKNAGRNRWRLFTPALEPVPA